jgi:cell division transport system ATP-binding protein
MIEFRQVSKQYPGSIKALAGVTLSIAQGELAFLAGPSGAGKSTLLKMVAAIERPSSGTVHLHGQNIGRLKPAALPYLRRRLGLIFQQQKLLDDRTVLANVMLPLIVTGSSSADAARRARAALDKVGLLERSACSPLALSGGEQQRVAIARAIVHRPQIILADEPTANLDRISAKKVLDALKSFHDIGVTCIISTHDESFLDHADRVIHLDQGSLVDDVRAVPADASAA